MLCLIDKAIIIKEIFLVVHVTLVNLNVMQKFVRMNIISQLKFQNQRNTIKVISATVDGHSKYSKNVTTKDYLEASYIAFY